MSRFDTTRFLLVCGAGAVGTGVRYLVALALAGRVSTTFPLATLTVNLLGCFLIALVVQLALSVPSFSDHLRVVLTTGFLGGLTTFSTFSAEVVQQLLDGRPGWALATVAVHVAGSLALTLLGIGTVALLRGLRPA